MKKLLFIILLTLIGLLLSQPLFSEISTSLPGVDFSSVDWGDYDNDGDLDMLVTGDADSTLVSKIYRNDSGIFVDIYANLESVYLSSAEWGDYDNDGDLDILLSGHNGVNRISKIYRNDSGIFIDINAGLSGVFRSSVSWGDYDNDGDLDIILTGSNYTEGEISKIYRNDSGNFVDISANLVGVNWSSTAWGDYDNDGDLDVLLTGRYYKDGYYYISSIYRNDFGVFSDIGVILPKICYSSVSWGDYDNDGDLDILMAGYNGSSKVTKIYSNDSGVFTDINAGLIGVSYGTVDWGDYDNDGDLDILLAGSSNSGVVSIIYNNDSGIFVSISSGLINIDRCSAQWADYDNDGDLDVLLAGRSSSGRNSTLYRNNSLVSNSQPNPPSNLSTVMTDSSVTFSWDKATDNETPQDGLSYNLYIRTDSTECNINTPMSDITNGYRKIVHIGNAGQNTSWTIKDLPIGTYYWSVQAIDHAFAGSEFADQQGFYNGFKEISADFEGAWQNTSSWGDFDNDNDLDVLITGGDSRIYRNDSGVFTDIEANLAGVYFGSSSWGDYDNDGDLDFLIIGLEETVEISKIYRNDAGEFIDIEADLSRVAFGSASWGDYDNDGDLDIMLTGNTGSERISKIYKNEVGIFSDINAELIGVSSSSVTWGDYDNDGDLDILLSGYTGSENVSLIYRNDENSFTELDLGIESLSSSSVDWGDYDNDGDLDILIVGGNGIRNYSLIYRNDSGSFIELGAGLEGIGGYPRSAAWGDYDNDGDLDILLSGYTLTERITKIYSNESGSFFEISTGLIALDNCPSVSWGDYDNDSDLDILLSGKRSNNEEPRYISTIYRNNSITPNTAPNPPSNLSTSLTDSTVTFHWDKATDNETPQDGLSYNLYIRTDSTECNINSPMSNISTGYRKVVNLGNAGQNTSWTINNLPDGRYYWSVQAIDHAFAGSEFAEEQSVYLIDLSTPNNVKIRYSDDAVNISWDSVPNATRYKIFASDEPLGNYTDMSSTGTFYGMNWKQYVKPSMSKKFYYVVAVVE